MDLQLHVDIKKDPLKTMAIKVGYCGLRKCQEIEVSVFDSGLLAFQVEAVHIIDTIYKQPSKF